MQGSIRNLVRSSPPLYKTWLYLRFGYKHKFPDKTTDLQVDGYQRSGNTFSSSLVRELFPGKRIVSHFHAVSTLKVAQRLKVPTIIVIRHPEGAIASSIVKRVAGRGQSWRRALAYDLHGYSHYYRHVLSHPTSCRVCVFESFIEKPQIIAEIAAELLEEPVPSALALGQATQRVMEALASDDRSAAMQKLANPEKQGLKEQVLQKVRSMQEFKTAVGVYESVLERVDEQGRIG